MGRQNAGEIAESSISRPTGSRERETLGLEWAFRNLKTHPRDAAAGGEPSGSATAVPRSGAAEAEHQGATGWWGCEGDWKRMTHVPPELVLWPGRYGCLSAMRPALLDGRGYPSPQRVGGRQLRELTGYCSLGTAGDMDTTEDM